MSSILYAQIYLFTFRITQSKLTSLLSTFILFFSGGLGFWSFFEKDISLGLISNLNSVKTIYTFQFDYNILWFNIIFGYIIPQRAFLFGFTLSMTFLSLIYMSIKEKRKSEFLLSGLTMGILPLFHFHAFLSLSIITLFLFFIFFEKDKEYIKNWIYFLAPMILISLPQIFPIINRVSSSDNNIFSWNFGWLSKDNNYILFWIKSTGLFIPLIIFSIISKRINKEIKKFYLAFIPLFIISNLILLAPLALDNAKVLYFWYIGSVPMVSIIITDIFKKNKVASIFIFFILTFSGFLDVMKFAFTDVHIVKIFTSEELLLAEEIKKKTEFKSVFINSPEHDHPIFFSGRISFLGDRINVWSHGVASLVDIKNRYDEVKLIYSSNNYLERKYLLLKNNIDYVIVGSRERKMFKVDELFFSNNYPIVIKTTNYKVYKIK